MPVSSYEARFSAFANVLLSCHRPMIICRAFFEAGNNPGKCVNQHLSAVARIYLLDTGFRSASVTPHALRVRDYWKGRADNTALTDRRRQSCRTPSKPSWPLASSPYSLPAPSRKSPWKSPWSWKSRLWRSSDPELSWSGRKPRPNPLRTGLKCETFPKSLFSWLSWRRPAAPCAKTLSWWCRKAPSDRCFLWGTAPC